ncbi:MAG: DUF454 domain-containing protein [Papillibacter sp.]|nr:DUF454 domain-containing protein [Papillibacter sp.]
MSLKKYILLISGTIALLLGVIGVLIPVLPTTPFLLIAAYCYLRSSMRLYNKLINHRLIGKYIYCYLTYRAVPRKSKIGSIILLWTALIVSMLLIRKLFVVLLLVAIGAGVTVHLLLLKNLSEEHEAALRESRDEE